MAEHDGTTDTTQSTNPRETESMAAGPNLLADLSSPRFADVLPDVELVLIPVGAHEQHGPSLPVSTDTISAQVLCALTGTLLRPRVAVAPAIPWGVSWHHLGIPGTVSLREETLISIVEDLVTSLHASGINRFLLVNTHGGNNAALHIAAERCHATHGVPIVASTYAYLLIAAAASEVLGPEAAGHGGGDEASLVLATRPDLVDIERFGPGNGNEALRRAQSILRAGGGVLPMSTLRVSPSGVSGDSTGASANAGGEILGRAASQLRAITEELMDLDLDAIQSAPARR